MTKDKNSPFVKQLIEFGLSEKEASVYLVLLELEIAVVSDIAKAANINRSSAYVVLESLKSKGLVSISEDKKIKRYIPTTPERFLYEAENKAKKAAEVKDRIGNLVPELKALHKDTKHKPKVRIYEGVDGLREVYWNLLHTEGVKDLRTFANPFEILKIFPDFIENHNIPRIQKGIKMYAINPATKECLSLAKSYTKDNPLKHFDKILLIPKEKFNFSSDVAIYKDKTVIASTKEKFGIVIESQEMTDLLKSIFDLAWEEAKRLNREILNEAKSK